MTKASGVGKRRKGRRIFSVSREMSVTMTMMMTMMTMMMMMMMVMVMVVGLGGPFRVKNHVMSLSSPWNTC